MLLDRGTSQTKGESFAENKGLWCLPMAAAIVVVAAAFFSATALPAASAIVEHTFVVSKRYYSIAVISIFD
jgi:hypothetical protein